jgi:hypothetical protein
MKKLIEQFNDFFGKNAHIVVKNNNMTITIGNKAMEIGLPTMAGGSSKAPLSKS